MDVKGKNINTNLLPFSKYSGVNMTYYKKNLCYYEIMDQIRTIQNYLVCYLLQIYNYLLNFIQTKQNSLADDFQENRGIEILNFV